MCRQLSCRSKLRFSASWRLKSQRSRRLSKVRFATSHPLEFQKVFKAKQSLIEKKSENEMVLQEFNLMADDAAVYKLVGPVLAKQDVGESKTNVEKRIEYISKEIERMDKLEADFQSKVEERRATVQKLQEDMRREFMKEQQLQQQQAAAGAQ